MEQKKKNLYAVSTEDLVFGIDYEVVTSTPFEEEKVDYFVKIVNHEIDQDLACYLGLGVIRNLHEAEDYYLYCASYNNEEVFSYLKQQMRFEMYYQLTHLAYENKRFEKFMAEGLGELLLERMFGEDAEKIHTALLQRYQVNKGNVLPFRKK